MRAFNPAEQRAFGRRESRIHAFVHISGRPPEPCIVRNYSDGGALLEIQGRLDIPAAFRLVIESKAVDALCEVRHVNDRLVGVQFVGAEVGTQMMQAGNHALPASMAHEGAAASEPPPAVERRRPFIMIPARQIRETMFPIQAKC